MKQPVIGSAPDPHPLPWEPHFCCRERKAETDDDNLEYWPGGGSRIGSNT